VHPDDRTTGTARAAAERAVAAAPQDVDALYLLSRAQAPESEDAPRCR
jgi:hypothetical protein